jgi:hypothetical protein
LTAGRRNPYFPQTHYTGYLQEISHIDGDRFWHRELYSTLGASNIDGENNFYDVIETSQGGFIAVGNVVPSSLDTGNTDIWIVGMDSLGCDTPNCVDPTSLRMPEPPKASFRLYPNPNDGSFRIRTKGNGRFEAELLVRNAQGKILHRERLRGRHPEEQRIRLDDPSPGIHFVEWKSGRSSYTVKMVVE